MKKILVTIAALILLCLGTARAKDEKKNEPQKFRMKIELIYPEITLDQATHIEKSLQNWCVGTPAQMEITFYNHPWKRVNPFNYTVEVEPEPIRHQ